MIIMMMTSIDADTILSTKNENALIVSMSELHRRKKNTAQPLTNNEGYTFYVKK